MGLRIATGSAAPTEPQMLIDCKSICCSLKQVSIHRHAILLDTAQAAACAINLLTIAVIAVMLMWAIEMGLGTGI